MFLYSRHAESYSMIQKFNKTGHRVIWFWLAQRVKFVRMSFNEVFCQLIRRDGHYRRRVNRACVHTYVWQTTAATFLRSEIHKSQSHLWHARADSNRPEGIYYGEFSESSNGLPSYLEYESITPMTGRMRGNFLLMKLLIFRAISK